MDFEEYYYTEEQERFRKEVTDWIDAQFGQRELPFTKFFSMAFGNIGSTDESEEYLDLARETRRELGKKGWLASTYPAQYGGGGLSQELEVILEEEMSRRNVPIHYNNQWIHSTLLVWGTEEQRAKWLTPLLRGEQIAYQAFTEPQSGTDLANVKCTAVREGDEWVINGTKCFVTGPGPERCDILYGPIKTDPEAPRHHNLGYFIIPADLPGVSIVPMDLLSGKRHTNFVFYDNVRVPADCLVGGDHQGWQVAQTSLEEEHGGRGRPVRLDPAVERLLHHARSTRRNGEVLGKDPIAADRVVESYIDGRIRGIFEVRNYSMFAKRHELTYEGSQANAYEKWSEIQNYARARDVYGAYSQVEAPDPRSPFRSSPDKFARETPPHAGGTLEIQKQIIARRLGISRTQERAAPTPATATTFSA